MARKTELTAEAVAEAAKKLVVKGEKPTVKAVHAALGGKGSMSTLVPMLAQWRDQQAENEALKDVDLPEELAESLLLEGAKFYRKAMGEATIGHEALRKEIALLKAEAAEAQAEFAELIGAAEEHADKQAAELATAQQRQEDMQAELVAAQQQVAVLSAQLQAETARGNAAEERVAKAESRAEKAEQRADKAEARADAAEAKSDKK